MTLLSAVVLGLVWVLRDRSPPADRVFASPRPGDVVAVPWMQVKLTLDDAGPRDDIVLRLDGEVWADPFAETHGLTKNPGQYYLGTLNTVPLTPGNHKLSATWGTSWWNRRTASTTFSIPRGRNLVEVRVTDQAGNPTDARIFVRQDGEKLVLEELLREADPHGRDRGLDTVFAINGRAKLRLANGRYRLFAVRGVRDTLAAELIDVKGDMQVPLVVDTVVPTPGWATADLHVHTARSSDAFVPHRERFASLPAAGLDFVVISDHNKSWDARELGEATHAAHPTIIDPGTELDVENAGKQDSIGHMNVFPALETIKPRAVTNDHVGAYVADVRAAWPASAGDLPGPQILQLNHPRGIQFNLRGELVPGSHALFNHTSFDPETPVGARANAWLTWQDPDAGTTALDMDAVEVVNRFSWTAYKRVRQDWYALWRQGYGITGTGNSDSHAIQVELAGLPSNLVYIGHEPFTTADLGAFHQSIVDGRVIVTTGPIVELTVTDGSQVAGPGELLSGSTLTARVRVRAAPWIPVPEVRLLIDGEVVQRVELADTTEVERGMFEWPVTVNGDGFVTAEAGWRIGDVDPKVPEPYAFVAPGYVPLAFTNPVRVDGDGDGAWVPRAVFGKR